VAALFGVVAVPPHEAISDEALIEFLKWCLPELGLRWPGYRKVRRLVGKRLGRRIAELGIKDLPAYRELLCRDPAEWSQLHVICRIPISRFYRDRGVFDSIGQRILPDAAAKAVERGDRMVRCWSAGCASGEEPYTIALIWRYQVAPHWPTVALRIVATDADETMIARAEAGCYTRSSLKELPREWVERAFRAPGALYCLDPELRRGVDFALQDIRDAMPDGPFDVIFCRNLAFTYFEEGLQRRVLDGLKGRLTAGGVLVLGMHEALPAGSSGFDPDEHRLPIYRRNPRVSKV
jgi:chemotaxis protein methyltransferase CheR